jgi:DNA polymerase III gamma/tau subunit
MNDFSPPAGNDTAPVADAVIGHNKGPSEGIQLIGLTLRAVERIERSAHEYLNGEHSDLMRRLKEILETAKELPAKIDDGDKPTAEKFSDVRYALKKWITAAKAARTAEKKPWDNIAKVFYAFFTKPIEDLEAIDEKQLGPIIKDWQDRETARQRREAEAEAQRLRDIAAAQEAERAAAEQRRLDAEKAEREAEERRAAAERERALEQKRQAEAKAAKEEQERLAAEAAARAAAAQKEREEQEKLAAAAKAQRDADEAASAAAREREEAANKAAAEAREREAQADRQRIESEAAAKRAQDEERASRERAQALRAQQAEAERASIAARKEQRVARRDEREAEDESASADKKADRFEDKAEGKSSDMSRIRGEAGSVSSLREFWNFRRLDRSALDLEQLRQHIPETALETAIRSFIDAGGRKLQGVEIFPDTGTTTR